jgi:hypothetical protein
MNWWEALDILDGLATGHRRDRQSRLEAIQVLAGVNTSGDEPPTAPSTGADQVQPE